MPEHTCVQIDGTTEFGARVLRRLSEEQIVWLTTVGAGGMPHPSPVWFLWMGDHALVFSEPDAPKVRNIARSPKVALSFNSTPAGGDVVILNGRADILREHPRADELPAYVAKYRVGIAGLGMSPEQFGAAYAVAIRITPRRLRGF